MNAALGSGCDTIDNAVTSNTRGPEFESSPRDLHRTLKYLLLTV